MRARGFSLVECLVAAVVLAIGLLAVAATVRGSQRLAREGALTARAVEAAGSRLARLSAAGCAAQGGSAQTGPFTETWTVAPSGAWRRARVAVAFRPDALAPRHLVVTLDLVCAAELP